MLSLRRRTVKALVMLLALASVLSACSSGSADPTSYIAKQYQRASDLDEDGIEAYTTTQKPEAVASEISANAEPLDRRTSSADAATDGGNSVFLQYSKRIVGIFPYQTSGSKVMVGEYKNAHSHWFVFIGGYWSSTPGYRGGGSGNRGGGSGSGK